MNCVEFEIQLQELLDRRELPRSANLELHASTCPRCRTALSDAMLLGIGILEWRRTIPSVDLTDRILRCSFNLEQTNTKQDQNLTVPGRSAERDIEQRSHSDRSPKPVGTSSGWLPVATSAAALVLMFWLTSANGPTDRHQTRIASRSKTAISNATSDSPNRHPDLQIVMASAGRAYHQLAQETVAVAEDITLLMPSRSLFQNSSGSDPEQKSAPTPSLLPENVYPVGDSVENALHYLWQAVPGIEKSAS